MLRIDGAAGGGQVLRWAVAMSALTETPVSVENIRGGRETPGLKPQHVAAISAVQAFTDADTAGVELESESIQFVPERIRGGTETIEVGTAGSIALVFDAVLPLAAELDEPLTLTVTGGTDVRWSPPLDFHRFVKLPVLRRFGVDAGITIDRRGFYPNGGGRARLDLVPASGSSIELTTRGSLEALAVHSVASAVLQDAEVADRQATAASEAIADLTGLSPATSVSYVPTDSPGSVLLLEATYEDTKAGFAALGERGTPSEVVGSDAVERFHRFHRSGAAIDVHLADQLLPFLGVWGGALGTVEVTTHIETARDLLDAFGWSLGVERSENTVTIFAE